MKTIQKKINKIFFKKLYKRTMRGKHFLHMEEKEEEDSREEKVKAREKERVKNKKLMKCSLFNPNPS